MNNETRRELESLQKRHAELAAELHGLATRLQRLETEMPRLEAESASHPASSFSSPARPAVPPPIPPVIPSHPSPYSNFPVPGAPAPIRAPLPSEGPESGAGAASTAPAPMRRSLEMRLGTYWLVRVGIVMLLTGLVFFGNYAYQHVIVRLGPGGKISLLYLASALLLGFGLWWQRKAARESMRNYAQVLFAGGLAAVYFTTYAAHHIPNLRVLDSALLTGMLLLIWAAFIVWIADRKKSEILALFAVGLAYYTSVITRVGAFTLYSNLVLTAAAVFFLVRNRWTTLSMAALVATYVSYGFWRILSGEAWRETPDLGVWPRAAFLASYWLLFTSAVFLSKGNPLKRASRAVFLTFNNGAFFALCLSELRTLAFWKMAMIFGGVLLLLAELARRIFRDESTTRNAYLIQGLLLATIALISKFAGMQLALLLGAESVVLFTLGIARRNPILQGAAFLTGALAVGWSMDGLVRDDWRALLLAASVGVMMAFNAFWAERTQPSSDTVLRPVTSFFTLLALISWMAAIGYNVGELNLPMAFAVAGIAVTLLTHILRVREFAVLGQGYLFLGHLLWLVRVLEPASTFPWWNPGVVIVVTLAMSLWWRHASDIVTPRTETGAPEGGIRRPLEIAYRWIASVMLLWWVHEYVPSREHIWSMSAIGLGLFLYAGWRRAIAPLLISALFTAAGLVFFWLPLHGAPSIYWPNLFALLALLVQQRLATHHPDRFQMHPRIQGACVLAGTASLWLFLSRWVLANASGFYLTAAWSAFALILFVTGMALRERLYRWTGLGILACALGRIVIFDVWKLETVYRILSFMALGIVLLVLGYLYNRFQEKFREWL